MGWEIKRRKVRGKVSKIWRIEIREGGQVIRESLGTDIEEVARTRAAKRYEEFKRQELSVELGLKTHPKTSSTPLDSLILEFEDELYRLGRTKEYRATTVKSIARLIEAMGASSLEEISADGIRTALATMNKLPTHFQAKYQSKAKIERLSARGQNRYRQALSQLFRWLVKNGRWDRNPCDQVATVRIIPGKAKEERRSLRPEELNALLSTAPRHRALSYRVASSTGLRRDELNEIRWEEVSFEDSSLTVLAVSEKARRGATLPLPDSTVRAWREYLREGLEFHEGRWNGREQSVWERRIDEGRALPPIPAVKTLRRDLKKAGIKVGRHWCIDLHALRVTYGSTLARAKVSLQQAQRLLRHSTPALTANIYTRLDHADGQEAARAFDRLLEDHNISHDKSKVS